MKTNQVYRCAHCKLQIEILVANENMPVPQCCGEAMQLQEANTVDAAKEKHVPVIEADGNGTLVKVGSITHPATPEHFIEWIELFVGNRVCRVQLSPTDAPQAHFAAAYSPELKARISCNLHGVWQNN